MAKAEKINDVLGSVLKNLPADGAGEFRSLWKNALDADERLHSAAAAFREGKLTVIVDNSIHLQNFLLKREKIRDRINLLSPDRKVSEICFRIGSIER